MTVKYFAMDQTKNSLLIFCLLFCSYAGAETVKTDLYNKDLFIHARQQILTMQMDELDEFRNYLSSCGTNSGGDIKRFFCERSARAYILKYGRGRSVEKLIVAMAEVEFLIDLVDEADEKYQSNGEVNEKMKMQVFRDLDRYIVIRDMMEAAIKAAYSKLLS